MKKRLFMGLMACLVAICPLAFGEYAVSSVETIPVGGSQWDSQVDKIFERYKTVGGAVVVMKGDQLVYERYYGYAKRNTHDYVDENTYFRLASITKWVTGIGVMSLVEGGQLYLDGDISDILGFPIENPHFPAQSVTLRMIMTHTSSITDTGGFKNQNNTLTDIFSKAKRKSSFMKKAPGTAFEYSNLAAGMAGSMIEEVTGQSVNSFMKKTVFEPLGIDAAYSPTLLLRPDDIVNQHEKNGVVARPYTRVLKEAYDDTPNANLHYRLTAGCLWITPRDLCKLLAMMNGNGKYEDVRILNEETVAKIHEDQVGQNGIAAQTPYALFCERFTTLVEGKVIYGHQGQSLSMVTEIFYDPDTGFGMALLTNGCSKSIDRRVCNIGRAMFTLLYSAF